MENLGKSSNSFKFSYRYFKWGLYVHRRRFFTRLSLAGILIVALLVFNIYMWIPSIITLSEITVLRTARNFSKFRGSLGKTMNSSISGVTASIVYYGIREHWLIFCNQSEFQHYRHLITFPRVITCPKENHTILVDFTRDPSEISKYDIVIFTDVHKWLTREMWDWTHGNRSEGQRWVMIAEESPLYVPGMVPPLKYANQSYDWFDSYKTDADFVHSYGKYESYGPSLNRPSPIDISKYLTNKTEVVAWMGSQCKTLQWNRMKFVNEFRKIIKLDTYGECGIRELPWNNDQLLLDTLWKYKFYLSLENSCCDDYLTKNFWRALEIGMVPVVLGAPHEHYRKFAPPNSFVHVDDFDSLSGLVLHLISVCNDDQKYLQYHKWRNEGRIISYRQEDQYVRPLKSDTQCDILKKFLQSDPGDQRRMEYFGRQWTESCTVCGEKNWVNTFMYPKSYMKKYASRVSSALEEIMARFHDKGSQSSSYMSYE